MTGTLTRRVSLVFVLALAMSLIITVGPMGQAAQALDPGLDPPKTMRLANGIPAPVAVPSSVIGSLDNATALERARMVGNTIPSGVVAGKVPVSVTTGVISKVGGPVAVSITGLQIGWSIGSGVASLMGMDSTASFQELTGLGPDPTYVPNNDWVPTQNGWVGSAQTTDPICWYANGCQSLTGTVTYGVNGEATVSWKQATAVSVGWTTQTAQPPSYAMIDVHINFWCINSTGTLQNTSGTTNLPYGLDHPQTYSGAERYLSGTQTSNCSTLGGTYTFDHITITRGYNIPNPGAVILTWYPTGHASRPAYDGSIPPMRMWETRWTCSNATTGVKQSVAFAETDNQWPAIPQAKCASGLQVDSVQVWEVVPTNHNMDVQISSWTRSNAVKDWQTNFPDCGDGTCLLTLEHLDSTTGTWTSCFSTPGPCAQWSTDPNKTTNYRCMYGTTQVALSECNAYVPTFDPATNTTTPFADPKTGEVPKVDPPPLDETSQQCWPSGWGVFNPVSWVLMPVKCALDWAFTPPPGATDGWSIRFNDWKGRPPISFMVGGFQLFTDVRQDWGQCGAELGCSTAMYAPTVNGSPRYELDPFTAAGDRMQGTTWGLILYKTATIGMWVTFTFFAWKRIGKSFGEKA